MLKRGFDIVVSVCAVVILAPLLLVLGVGIKLSSPGDILFRQVRVGKNDSRFNLYKFRSMVSDAEAVGSYQTADNDPRITKFGSFLRHTSLDELPQLFNILKGDMSLVGPRPDVPAQQSNYSPEEWNERVSVKPGLTGLAQATLRSNAVGNQRLMLDLEYVRNANLVTDIKIILMTVRQIITKGGN